MSSPSDSYKYVFAFRRADHITFIVEDWNKREYICFVRFIFRFQIGCKEIDSNHKKMFSFTDQAQRTRNFRKLKITWCCCCDSCVDCAHTLPQLPSFYDRHVPENFRPNRHRTDDLPYYCALATWCSCRSPFWLRHMFAYQTNCHLLFCSSTRDWPFWRKSIRHYIAFLTVYPKTYRCWKTFKSAPGFGRLCEPFEKRSRIDWLSWAAVGPVSEKLRCCVFGGIFICKSAVHVCVPPDTFNLFDRGTADTWAVRPPFVPISIVWPSCVAKAPLAVFM